MPVLRQLGLFLQAAPKHPLVHFFFHLGLAGLLVISAVDSSFIPLPIPGITDIMIIVYAANKTNVFLLVGMATVGSALGGLFSHAVGQAGGKQFLEKNVPKVVLKRVTVWMDAHSIWSVALPALLPPPMPLSPFVLAAGASNMSRKKFMWAFTVSRFVRHSIAAWLGVHYGRGIVKLWNEFSAKWGLPFLIVLWTVIIAFTAIAIWRLVKTSRELKMSPRGRARTA